MFLASPTMERRLGEQCVDKRTPSVQLHWHVYRCGVCGGFVTARSVNPNDGEIDAIYPASQIVSSDIPSPARDFLQQALESRHTPSGAVLLAASAIDATLKNRGYEEGSLFQRIDEAKDGGLITEGMAEWAHNVRLDANDQRHADVDAGLPTLFDGERSVEFALALAELLFVLPARVTRGLAGPQEEEP